VRAGLEPGDIVTAIAGRAMRKPGDALTALYLQRPGDRVPVAIRRGGQEKTLTLEIPR
jgi:S1-C subfamily serine protease